jgi:DNA-binding SARP family transcriptional activator
MPAFCILGAIGIRKHDRFVMLGGGILQQTLLAALLVSAGSVVTADSLTDELWGTTPPAKVENALQAQVSRLRRRLTQAEPERGEPRLQTSPSGYLFTMNRTELDAWVFMDAVEAIRARAEHDVTSAPRSSIAELRRILQLWRGPVFGGLAGGPICQTAANRFREARNATLALLYELELRQGGHARILPELIELYAQNPLREQFCALLIVAFYRAGRQIDALNTYRRFKCRLGETLGIEPSPVLNRYEQAILTHDPSLMRDDLALRSYAPGNETRARQGR